MTKLPLLVACLLLQIQGIAGSCNYLAIADCAGILTSSTPEQIARNICGYWRDFSSCMGTLRAECSLDPIWLTYRSRFDWLRHQCPTK